MNTFGKAGATADWRGSRAAILGLCVTLSAVGGLLAAMAFLGMMKVLSDSWDLSGFGPMAFRGSLVGLLVGLPGAIVMSGLLADRGIPKGETWAWVLMMLPLGAGLSFLAFVAWMGWVSP